MRIGQHQSVRLHLRDFCADAAEFVALAFARELHAVNGHRPQWRSGAFCPDGIDRIAFDCDKFGPSFFAGFDQSLRCRRSMQPGVKTEAVSVIEICCEPVFRRWIDQGSDFPGARIHLLGGLERVAAIHENGSLLGKNHC